MIRVIFQSLNKVRACQALSSHLSPSLAATGPQVVETREYNSAGRPHGSQSSSKSQWEILAKQGYDVNPCNSKLHPAYTEAGIEPEEEAELAVQEAYTPESDCFGCGPVAAEGLRLRSFRVPGGLEATLTLDKKYCAFPGIINGGIVSAIFDCHGNWTAAIALMDRACLPKPPLTLTFEMLVTFHEPTPPEESLTVRSQIVRIKESSEIGTKSSVQVDMSLYHNMGGHEKLVATCTGIFKKLGALRAL